MIFLWWNIVRVVVACVVVWSIFAVRGYPHEQIIPSVIVAVWQLVAAWLIVELIIKRDRKYRLWQENAWSYEIKSDMEYFATKIANALEKEDIEAARDVLRRAQPALAEALEEVTEFRANYGSWLERKQIVSVARIVAALRDLQRLPEQTDRAQFLCGVATASMAVYGGAVGMEWATQYHRGWVEKEALVKLHAVQMKWLDESARNHVASRKF